MEKISMVEAGELVRTLGEKIFKEVKTIDNLGSEFVIENNGHYFTVVIHPHSYRGQLSPQILERFERYREFHRLKEEADATREARRKAREERRKAMEELNATLI